MSNQNSQNMVKELKITALATDPIYIGTGGYTIGRVDNTIVRDPITRLPKIPGSSLAGTWRYYMALELQSKWREYINLKKNGEENSEFLLTKEILKDKLENLLNNIEGREKELVETILNERIDNLTINKDLSFNNFIMDLWEQLGLKFNDNDTSEQKSLKNAVQGGIFEIIVNILNKKVHWTGFIGNRFAKITCAGQDNVPDVTLDVSPYATKDCKTGHCGHCIVCKSFGFSKKDISWQGMLFLSDLEILLFPVYTRLGTRWITTKEKLEDFINNKQAKIKFNDTAQNNITEIERHSIFTKEKDCNENSLNLGWLNLDVKGCWTFENNENDFEQEIKKHNIDINDIIIVHEDIFSQIVNSNLEVRTSVSIDPLTGAAKEKALFTSEAIPRGTVFSGCIRIFEKAAFADWEQRIGELPTYDMIKKALEDSKKYYESLGIGGMTTRGFGRMKIELKGEKCSKRQNEQAQTTTGKALGTGSQADAETSSEQSDT